jgi:hypothetical protein
VGEIFTNFNLFIYGGKFRVLEPSLKIIGRKVDSIELFPASEGFLPISLKGNVVVVKCGHIL